MIRDTRSPAFYRCAHDAPTPRRRGPLASLACAAALGASLLSAHANAGLGGFEADDGYAPFLNMVQNYNAGQYGAACGYGGMQMPIAPNSGLWEALAGGFFSGGSVSYATGHSYRDRTYTNSGGASGSSADQGLVLTTGHEGWTGPALKYKYNLDACDLGCDPASTGNKTITVSFWVCAQLPGAEIGGQVPDGYFGDEIAFLDSTGAVGFTLGLTQRSTGDKVTYWNGATMFESTIIGASNRYDRWDITLDLANDTVSADYYQFSSNTTTTLLTSVPMMGAGMIDFSAMTFRTSPGVNNAKLMSIDDFVFDGCDDCDAVVEETICELDGSGDVTATITVANNSGVDATRILITPLPPPAGVGVTPNVINQVIPDGTTHTFDVTFSGLVPGEEFCFVVTLLDETGQQCCSTVICFTHDCDCLQVRNETESIICMPDGPPGTYLYTFQFDNLTPDTIHHVYFFPPSGVTINPNYLPMTPPIGPNQTSQPIMLMITGVNPGDELCFEVAIHDEFLNECCTRTICITIPECDGGKTPRGACCFEEPGVNQPLCVVTTAQECQTVYHGVYLGDNTTCNPNPCIPDPDDTTTHLTPVTRCCMPDDQFATTTLTICNTTGAPRTYNWTLNSVVNAMCPVAIPPGLITPNNGTVTVGAGDCVDIPIRIRCEGNQGMYCLESTVTDTGSGATYTNTGKLTVAMANAGGQLPDWCVKVGNPDNPTTTVQPGTDYVNADFTVTNNTDSAALFMYRAIGGGTVRVDGRPSGVGVENFLLVEPGETLPVLFAVALAEDRPFEIFDVILFSDLDGDGVDEPLISHAYTTARGEPCVGDTNADNAVNFADLNTILTCFGAVGGPDHLLGDLTGDGVVNFADLNLVLSNFGTGCN